MPNPIIKPPSHAVEVLEDSDRYKCRYKVASASSGKLYMVSFDAAAGAGYWTCSCMGCIRHGQCKHLTAAGLRGRKHGRDSETILKLGLGAIFGLSGGKKKVAKKKKAAKK
jgi:hypothetical protein